MRLSLVTETYPPEVNGVSHTLAQLVTGLARRGHQIEVVHPRQRAAAAEPFVAGVRHLEVPGLPIPVYRELRFGLPCGRRLLAHWSRRPPDLVHVATEGPLGWSALSAAERLKLPVSSSYHTNFHRYGEHYGYGALHRLALAYLRWIHNRTGCTMVPSPDARHRLAAAGFERLAIVSRGIDAALFDPARRDDSLRADWGATPDTPVIAHVGRLAPEKNIDLVFDAVEAARRSTPDVRLVLVGDGPAMHRLRRLHPHAHFAGMCRGEDLATHYASADVFLFPSLTETFGNVVLEAMASGLAVVAYDEAAARMHIRDGVNGLVVPPGDESAFVAATRSLLQTPEVIRRLGTRARCHAESWSWDRVVDRFEEELHGVLAAPRRDRRGRSAAGVGKSRATP